MAKCTRAVEKSETITAEAPEATKGPRAAPAGRRAMFSSAGRRCRTAFSDAPELKTSAQI
eukprot:6650048-Pyramimonas_sp.AAC.1